MMSGPRETDVLTELRNGGQAALDRLVPLVYEELRLIAHRQLAARARSTSTWRMATEASARKWARSRQPACDWSTSLR